MTDNKERSWAEPYKIKMVELLKMTTRNQRLQAVKDAGYNTFYCNPMMFISICLPTAEPRP